MPTQGEGQSVEYRSDAMLRAELVHAHRVRSHRVCAVIGVLLGLAAAVALFTPVTFSSGAAHDLEDSSGFDDYTYACGSVLSPASVVGSKRIEFSDECAAARTSRARDTPAWAWPPR